MKNTDWNPDLYLKFDKERIQPTIDLVSRIEYEHPEKIIDIGCGPGNSTHILARRWPEATITGADSSPKMIEKARKDFPGQNWQITDVSKDTINEKYDIIFSNSAIQWMPDHEGLVKKFCHLLRKGGKMAVQLPLFLDMPLGKIITRAAKEPQWASRLMEVDDLFTIHDFTYYYDLLAGTFNEVEIWETHYMHIMESHDSLMEMMESTGLKPYHERLKDKVEIQQFDDLVLSSVKMDYPLQKNGRVILPFYRLFFIGGV